MQLPSPAEGPADQSMQRSLRYLYLQLVSDDLVDPAAPQRSSCVNKQGTRSNGTERFHERNSAMPAASQTYYRVIYLFRETFSSDVPIGGEISRVLAGHRYSRRLVGQLHAVAYLVDLLPARPTALNKNEKPSPETKRGPHDSQKS